MRICPFSSNDTSTHTHYRTAEVAETVPYDVVDEQIMEVSNHVGASIGGGLDDEGKTVGVTHRRSE